MANARASLVACGHPVGQDRVGPPAWRCWKNVIGKPAKLNRKEAGLLSSTDADELVDEQMNQPLG